jgi:hypothetical protein
VHSGQWIAFYDAAGIGYAQPDHYIVFPDHVLLIECKLSQKSMAFPQMGRLYAPLLREIYHRPVVGVLVCKKIRYIPDKYWITDIQTLFKFDKEEMYTWHAWGQV